jgi:hypothetical protein
VPSGGQGQSSQSPPDSRPPPLAPTRDVPRGLYGQLPLTSAVTTIALPALGPVARISSTLPARSRRHMNGGPGQSTAHAASKAPIMSSEEASLFSVP